MKNRLDYLFLLAPALVWGTSLHLGDQLSLPNRLMLAALYTAAGAGALLTRRNRPGVLALVMGLCMLASLPITHEIPSHGFASGENINALAQLEAFTDSFDSLQDQTSQYLLFPTPQ